jgi:cytochrome c oxidase subunit IV
MTPDWPLWVLLGAISGFAYALAVYGLNYRRQRGGRFTYLVLAEIVVFLILAAGLIMGLTGLWWLWRYIALAYITLGGPIAAVVLVITASKERDEYAEVSRIRDTVSPVRNAGLRGGKCPGDPRAN